MTGLSTLEIDEGDPREPGGSKAKERLTSTGLETLVIDGWYLPRETGEGLPEEVDRWIEVTFRIDGATRRVHPSGGATEIGSNARWTYEQLRRTPYECLR